MFTDASIVEKQLPLSFTHLFFARVLLFVTLIVVFDLWLVKHTGHGLRDPRVIGGIGGILFYAFTVSKSVISTADEETWKKWIRQVVAAVLDFRLLTGLYLVAGFVMLTISSVTIMPESDGQRREAFIQSMEGSNNKINLKLNSDVRRQWVWVSPFGRIYQVSINGYLPSSFVVYPLVGKTIHPERDLPRSPTILIRPSLKALQSLRQCETDDSVPDNPIKRCGWFRLCQIDKSGNCTEIGRVDGHSSSFLIGWPQAVPPGLLQDWRLELTILGAGKAPEIEAETILAWQKTKLLTPNDPVTVGAKLRAEVYTKSKEKEIVASKTFIVANTPFIDILMETVTLRSDTR